MTVKIRGGMWRQTLRRLVPKGHAWTIRTWLLSTPGIASLYLVLNPILRRRRVTRQTVLTIDGFPRSANGFVSYAFEMLLPDGARLSTLTHAPASIRRAARWNTPAILLVREPDAVVSSILTYDPDQTPAAAFTGYAMYYEAVAPVAGDVVVATFADATSDLTAVAHRLQERYRLDIPEERLAGFRPDEVFSRLDEAAAAMVEREEISPQRLQQRISRPVEGRPHVDLGSGQASWAKARDRAWRAYRAVVDA